MTAPTPQRENKTMADVIDEAWMGAASGKSALQGWLLDHKGSYQPLFMDFYYNFDLLVTLTSCLTEMSKNDDDKELTRRCEEWLDLGDIPQSREAAEKRIESGIALFKAYYSKLNFNGVITLRK